MIDGMIQRADLAATNKWPQMVFDSMNVQWGVLTILSIPDDRWSSEQIHKADRAVAKPNHPAEPSMRGSPIEHFFNSEVEHSA